MFPDQDGLTFFVESESILFQETVLSRLKAQSEYVRTVQCSDTDFPPSFGSLSTGSPVKHGCKHVGTLYSGVHWTCHFMYICKVNKVPETHGHA